MPDKKKAMKKSGVNSSSTKKKKKNIKKDAVKKDFKVNKANPTNVKNDLENKQTDKDKKSGSVKVKDNNKTKEKLKKDNQPKVQKMTSDVKKKNIKSKHEPLFTKKTKKIFMTVAIICLVIILIEIIYVVVHKINMENSIVYYDAMNSITIDDTDIVSVGSSSFKYSKFNDYTNGVEKGKLIKYDKNGKVLFEKMYDKGISNTFSSIITVDDGYIVVGSGVFSEKELEEEAREAFIIKYDKKGNIVWEKFYQVVTDTKFNKVIEVEDGYIAVGQSIYANMEMGNHTTGGGIIVKYDKDGNEVWHNNHGGMKSGNFNDVVEVDGDLYVVGKDATDSANIVKYNKDGKYVWHKNYSYTDSIGFTGIAYVNKLLYVVGSKKILPKDFKEGDSRDTTNTDALLIAYDLDGKKKFEKTFGGSNYERYNSIMGHNGDLYVVGHTSSKDAGFKIDTDGKLMTGLIIRYDENGNILKKDILGGSNNDNLTDIITDGACIYISAYSNSDDGNITTAINNGKDYFGKMVKLDFKFRTILVK